MKQITYSSGYKYQLKQDYTDHFDVHPQEDIKEDFYMLTTSGDLTIKKGYAWDGPSGPVPDTSRNMRGSLIHDVFYQMMRHQQLDHTVWRIKTDKIFADVCHADGTPKLICNAYFWALKNFAKKHATVEKQREIIKAPK